MPHERRELSRIVTGRVKDELLRGDIVAPNLAGMIADENEELVAGLGQQLAVTAIAAMVRSACKNAVERSTASLFDWAGDDFPRAIAVPTTGDGKECRYVALSRATVGNLHGAVGLLTDQIVADTKRRNRLRDVLDMCLEHGGQPNDLIVELLSPDAAA